MASNVRVKGAIFCSLHPTKKLISLCQDCENTLLCLTCMTKGHKGHDVVELDEITKEKFTEISDFAAKTEETTIPSVEKGIHDAELLSKDRDRYLRSHIAQVRENEQFLIDLVKQSAKETISELEKLIKRNEDELDRFRNDSENILKTLKTTLKECQEARKSDKDILIVDTALEVAALSFEINAFSNGKDVELVSESESESLIKAAVGVIRLNDDKHKASLLHVGRENADDITHDRRSTTSEARRTNQSQEIETAIQTPNIENTMRPLFQSAAIIDSGVDIYYECSPVGVLDDGTIILHKPYSDTIYFVELSGGIIQQKLDSSVENVRINPTNNKICCSYNKHMELETSIREIDSESGKTRVLFKLKGGTPICIAITYDGDFVIYCYFDPYATALYANDGSLRHKVEEDDHQPLAISICKQTGNIGICFSDNTIRIVDSCLRSIFTYQCHKSEFRLSYITFDQEGRLLVCDNTYSSSSMYTEVYVVDGRTGQFIQNLFSENIGYICGITPNDAGELLVITSSTTEEGEDNYNLLLLAHTEPADDSVNNKRINFPIDLVPSATSTKGTDKQTTTKALYRTAAVKKTTDVLFSSCAMHAMSDDVLVILTAFQSAMIYFVYTNDRIRQRKLDVAIADIGVHPTTDEIFCVCCKDNSIRTIDQVTGKTAVKFQMDVEPEDEASCIAITKDTILVGFANESKIITFSTKGEIKHTEYIDSAPSAIVHIATCPRTGSIAVSFDCRDDIRIINYGLCEIFTYRGPPNVTDGDNKFSSANANFDNEGHLLIADNGNDQVHIVDASGNHLKSISSQTVQGIYCLTTQQNGDLVVNSYNSDTKSNCLIFFKYVG